ncbi:MAG: hypothetical protein WAT19_04860 [Ferruginibacter sp.]
MYKINCLSASNLFTKCCSAILLFAIFILTTGCPPASQQNQANFVIIPGSDNTLPSAGITINDGNINKDFNENSAPTTLKVGQNVTVIAGATDNDGGIKSVELWATYTHYKPGQTIGPGLAGNPVKKYLGNENVGTSVKKNRFFTHSLDMKNELGTFSSVKADLWVVGENFHLGKTQTPVISLTYP